MRHLLLILTLVLICPVVGSPTAAPGVAPAAAQGTTAGTWPKAPPDYAYTPVEGCPADPLPLPMAVALAKRSHRDAAYAVCADQMALFQNALERARSENRLLLVEFGASWCPRCAMLSTQLDGPAILGRSEANRTLGDDFITLKIGLSTMAKGRLTTIPSGEAVLLHVLAQAPGARIRAIPYLAVIDPARPASTVGRNLDDLQQATADTSEPTFDADALACFLIAARDHARHGSAAPTEPGWIIRKLRQLLQSL